MKWRVSLALLFISSNFVLAQERVIEGVVFDSEERIGLENAVIRLSGTSDFSVTDKTGYFSHTTDILPDSIYISLLGYQTASISVADAGHFYRIPLHQLSLSLNTVIIATEGNQKNILQTPRTISVLNAELLEKENAISAINALNYVPGVFIHAGTYSTNRITIRGIGSRSPYATAKIKAYFNEIPITSGEGVTTIEDLELNAIGKIEIIKGPVSSIYGAGLGGVMLIYPYKAAYQTTSISQKVTGGSFGFLTASTTIASNTIKSNVLLNYSKTHSDGYRENSGYDRHSLTAGLQFFPGKKSTLTFFNSYTKVFSFIPSSVDSTTFYESPQSAAESWEKSEGYEDYHKVIGGIAHTYAFAKGFKNTTSVFIQHFDNYEPRPFDILEEQRISYGVRSLFDYTAQLRETHSNWILGAEVLNEWIDWQTFENNNNLRGEELSDLKERRFYYNIFTRINFDFKTGTGISAGLNFNQTRYVVFDQFERDSIDQTGDYAYDPILSPYVGINQKIGSRHAWFISASHGFAPPTVAETLTPEGIVNTDIVPETGISIESGFKGSIFGNKLSYMVSGYYMPVKDKLVAKRVGPDDYIGVNAGSTVHSGIEAEMVYDIINKQEHLRWFVNYTFAHYRFREFVDEDHDHSGNELTGTTPHHLNTGLQLETRWGFYTNLHYRFVDRIPMLDNNSKYADAYHLLNGKIGLKRTFLEKINVDLFFGINNITNTHYAAMILVNAVGFGGAAPRFYYPGLPVNFYGGLRLKYCVTC